MMIEPVKFAKQGILQLRSQYRQQVALRQWNAAGRPAPPPHLIKQGIVREFAKKYDIPVLVETGTYMGDMVYAMRNLFSRIYSIELSVDLHQQVQERFSRQNHIVLLQGDSGEVLAGLLPQIDQPCLFWLDGHYSAGFTAKGNLDTPIEKELAHIANHPLKQSHIILIDDARCFTGEGDYPGMETLKAWADAEGFDSFQIENDCIRIFNAKR
jgi:hypothetical protein